LDASKVLVDVCVEKGLHALVGKVCMDRNSPDFYREASCEASLADTRRFVEYARNRGGELVGPIITPRFAISCTSELMTGLGRLAEELNVPIQSHIGENCSEISFTRELHPENAHYTDVYHSRGLLKPRTIMAHAVYLTDDELAMFASSGAGASHCPRSNLTLCSGVANVRRLLAAKVPVGVGTDMSGGPSPSVWDAMRGAIETSVAVWLAAGAKPESSRPLSYREAFFLGTQGGAHLLGMADRLGNFAPGKWFNAQIINPFTPNMDTFGSETTEDLFQKCFYLLDDRNIERVFVKGKQVV
jgi:guanine deaminase